MAQKIFIAATGQNSGKSTTSLSLLHLAQKSRRRIGFIKPLGPKPAVLNGLDVDKDAALMAQVFGLEELLPFMSPVVVKPGDTKKALDGRLHPAELEERILAACAELERHCDFIIIEGSGHPGVGSVLGLSNARIARLLGAPVLMVTGGGVGNVIDAVHLNLALFEKEGAEMRAILANKIIAEKREITLDYLRRGLAQESLKVLGGFNYQPVLANPTLRRIARVVNVPLQGDPEAASRIVHHIQIGAASTQRVVELLHEDTLLVVTSSRDELLVTMANLYQIPEYRNRIVGLVIPGTAPLSKITQQILDRSNIPYLRDGSTHTTAIYQAINDDVSKTSAEDVEKIDLIRTLAEKRIDFEELAMLFG
ncbi:phosphotransacetylase family protein [Geoalkalibacter halelectricus]|uniref:AAA family ATPase n=1 Tax=Geoalkalibacter halelectricus TaxID=2847045 RepID=A0ABY5ZQ61_9BACT|nr:AAA family ATPase [Geoalkalibacter halelectricus]MDO3378847.1 AAA family ATPase [Geoalkalibacter halelectricus]UWZ79849.1 AAA family ATPase [Geoalkalibacter halelectricus]